MQIESSPVAEQDRSRAKRTLGRRVAVSTLGSRHSIGAALLMAGLPGIWVIRYWLGAPYSQVYTVVLLATGVVLLLRPMSLLRLQLYGGPVGVALLVGSVASLFAFAAAFAPTGDDGLASICLVLAASIAIFSVPLRRLAYLTRSVAIVSSASCILVLMPLWLGQLRLDGQRLVAGLTASPNQVAFTGSVAVVSGFLLFWHGERRVFSAFLGSTAVASGLATVFVAETRSTVVGLGLCGALALFRAMGRRKNRTASVALPPERLRRQATRLVSLVVIAIAVTYGATSFGASRKYASRFVRYTRAGYRALVLGQPTGEVSAQTRRRKLEEVGRDWTLLGRGYKAKRVDVPLAQAFYDMGLVGGVWFLGVTVIVPFILIWKILTEAQPLLVRLTGVYMYVLFLPNLLLHGQPYDFTIWFPVVLLYGVGSRRFRDQADCSASRERRVALARVGNL